MCYDSLNCIVYYCTFCKVLSLYNLDCIFPDINEVGSSKTQHCKLLIFP